MSRSARSVKFIYSLYYNVQRTALSDQGNHHPYILHGVGVNYLEDRDTKANGMTAYLQL